MKRTKTVFTGAEIAHVWANEGAPSGKTSGTNPGPSFRGDAFYSWAACIARRIRFRGKVAYVVDSATFSSRTSKHQSRVRSAIPDSATVFSVNKGGWTQDLMFTPATLRDWYLTQYRSVPTVSRYHHVNAEAFLHRVGMLDKAIAVCRFFGLSHKTLDREHAKIAGPRGQALSIKQDHDANLSTRREERRANRRARQDAADAARVTKAISAAESAIATGILPEGRDPFGYNSHLLDSRPDLQAGILAVRRQIDAATIQDWLAGKPANPKADWPTLLRAESNEMVTTRGARVSLSDAKRAYLFAKRVQSKGWHRNGEQFKIGMYDLDSVNEQGVIAGCHRVTWEEIDRFAGVMGWA